MQIVTSKEAREKGLNRYYTGRPCKYGHVTERNVTNGVCVKCHNKRVKRRKDKLPETAQKKREYIREYYKKNREKIIVHNTVYKSKNQEKYKAHNKVKAAIRVGRLTPQPCQRCGSLKVQAHHSDYSKPFDVTWLCSKHHGEEHAHRG